MAAIAGFVTETRDLYSWCLAEICQGSKRFRNDNLASVFVVSIIGWPRAFLIQLEISAYAQLRTCVLGRIKLPSSHWMFLTIPHCAFAKLSRNTRVLVLHLFLPLLLRRWRFQNRFPQRTTDPRRRLRAQRPIMPLSRQRLLPRHRLWWASQLFTLRNRKFLRMRTSKWMWWVIAVSDAVQYVCGFN